LDTLLLEARTRSGQSRPVDDQALRDPSALHPRLSRLPLNEARSFLLLVRHDSLADA
jgi:hypothetical protein